MALVFPASPINGQTYTSGGVTYTWDTVKWSAGIVTQVFDLSSTQTITGAKTFGATLTATGGISMTNTTSNLLLYSSTGVAAPTDVTRSAGTKIVLYPSVGIGTADYAIGIENFTLWNSVVNAANGLFKWYGGTTLAATLSGTGNLTVVGTVSGTNITTGGNVTGSSASCSGNAATATTATTAASCSGNAATATTAASCSGNAATATTATNVLNGSVSATSGTFSGAVGIGGVPTAVKLEVLSTDAILVPKGTTVEQPTGVAGYLRFNTTTSQFEGYNGSAWGSMGIGTSSPVDQLVVSGEGQLIANLNDAGSKLGTIYAYSPGQIAGDGGALLLGSSSTGGVTTPQWAIKSLLTNGAGNGIGDLVISGRALTADSSITERVRINNTGILSFNSGYGSVAKAYGCRAWINFNGTGIVTPRASGNVSTVTDDGVGLYTVNFAVAMPDAKYSCQAITNALVVGNNSSGAQIYSVDETSVLAGSVKIGTGSKSTGDAADFSSIHVAVFR